MNLLQVLFNISDITYGETVKIYSNVVDENNVPLNNGTLSVIINGKTYSADVSNGTVTLEIPDLDVGNYTVDVKYVGNELVAVSSVTFSVFKQNATITAKNKAYIINYGGKYSIILKDANGNVIAGKKVSFKLNGKNIGSAKTTYPTAQGKIKRIDIKSEYDTCFDAVFLSPTARAPEIDGTKTVAKAIFIAIGRLSNVSLLAKIPARRTASSPN